MLKRVKRRYIALAIDCNETLSTNELVNAIWLAISKLYGEYGTSRTGLALIEHNIEKKSAVIRVTLTALSMTRASLASITRIENKNAALHIIAISGTLHALRKKMG